MLKIRFFLFSAVLFAVSGCASSAPPAPGAEGPNGPDQAAMALQRPGLLLKSARDQQAAQGCAKAVPAYRVVSSFGDGHEAAQYELGACLLKLTEENGPEAALFTSEALFWLRRAAWAGNARAQGELARILSGADHASLKNIEAAPAEALGWALVYAENSDRELYNLPPVDPSLLSRLHSALSEDAVQNARAFANAFQEIHMAQFTAPDIELKSSAGVRRRRSRQPGRRPRRAR